MIVCGSNCGHDHESGNGPTGCCPEHGPYLYFCNDCHQQWADAHPKTVESIKMMADPKVSFAKAQQAMREARKVEPS